VLCEYDLEVNYTKEIIFFLALIIFYMYMKSKSFDVNIGWWIFMMVSKIDNNDEIYQELKVWKDTNSDGITDEVV
jgi:hypothetical protein